ncbi:7-carboxy-7-deazaguanine synthase QueE [Neobacillus sp. YIM B06451]|uniref:7-carboxy-7-deazaguanine synthase QueE n=1 Tax=Neobacillus sp. YIM B06451 TaxID=3070994 RepID=UPI0029310F29|nr:7-carboxy-7-deazaguanine synthase QueE [Neobacillus sp. YIM B06451]
MSKIPVMEIFGPTIQGEGMVMGRKSMFVRTAGCDYKCSWCDSAFTWDGSEKERIRMMAPMDVFQELKELGGDNFDHVTITGGNPALIGEAMKQFIELLHQSNIEVGLETQGSKWQDWFYLVNDLTISPKPPSSGMKPDLELLDDIIRKLKNYKSNFSLKIVVFDDADFEFAKMLNNCYMGDHIPFFLSVGNSNPGEEGDISSRLLHSLDWLWGKVLEDPEMNNVRPLPQLHALVWSNKRGV